MTNSQLRTMALRPIEDWMALVGVFVEIRLRGRTMCSGPVDAVTGDGSILWVHPPGSERKLYEKAGSYEAWTDEQSAPFLYRNSAKTGSPSSDPQVRLPAVASMTA